jgi:hypothetical protein
MKSRRIAFLFLISITVLLASSVLPLAQTLEYKGGTPAQPDNFLDLKTDLEKSDLKFNKLMTELDDIYYPKVQDKVSVDEFKKQVDSNDRIESSLAEADSLDNFINYDNNNQSSDVNGTFSFKQIPEGFRDSKYMSIEEIPVDENIKRQVVDYLILPRTNTYNVRKGKGF